MPISNIKNDADEMQMHETLRGSCLRADWDQTTLGEICARQNGSIQTGPFGSQLHTSDYKEFGTPVVMPTNIGDSGIDETGIARISQEDVNRLSQHVLKKGDIVFSRRGDVTKNALVRTRETGWFCGTGCLKVRVGDESIATADFISQYLRLPSIKEWLVRHAVGATMPNLNTGILAAVPVTLPSLDEQKQIAKILDDFDHKIELNRQTNQTLEQIAQALFKIWFVDFEPTRAKIAAKEAGALPEEIERAAMCAISGKTPDQLTQLTPETQQNLKTTAALFPDALVDSELGEVPEGWEVGTLANLCRLNESSWSEKNAPEEVNYVDLANTKNGIIEEVQRYSWSEAPSRARRILKAGDTIIGTVRPGNRSFSLIGTNEQVLTASTGFAVLSPKKKEYVELLYIASTSNESIDRLAHLADGGAYPAVRPDVVTQLEMVIPCDDLIEVFSELNRPVFTQMLDNLDENLTLKNLRDSLLPKLLSGEIVLN